MSTESIRDQIANRHRTRGFSAVDLRRALAGATLRITDSEDGGPVKATLSFQREDGPQRRGPLVWNASDVRVLGSPAEIFDHKAGDGAELPDTESKTVSTDGQTLDDTREQITVQVHTKHCNSGNPNCGSVNRVADPCAAPDFERSRDGFKNILDFSFASCDHNLVVRVGGIEGDLGGHAVSLSLGQASPALTITVEVTVGTGAGSGEQGDVK